MRKDISEKNELIKSVSQNYLSPALNLQKGLANKDYEESKSHNSPGSNSHNEKLNNSKSETTNCTDDIQINNRQSCDHVKLCQLESSNCPSRNNSGNEKETGNKTEFKESSQKSGMEKRVFILGDSILKHVNGYEITKKTGQLQSIREEFFWSKNKMYGGLCATCYQNQSRPYSYSRWYKRSFIKERVSRNFHRHRLLSFETEIRHLSGFSFKSNNTK